MRVVKCRKIGGEWRLSKAAKKEACKTIYDGGLVVYPTETVYGLGADPFRADAVEKVFAAKRRSKTMPISIAVPSHEAIWLYAVLDEQCRRFCSEHLPGPMTVLVRANSLAPSLIVSKEGLIGVRVPDHTVALDLLGTCSPLTTTSANRHNHPPSVTCEKAVEQLGDDVSLYIDAGPCRYGRESTVVEFKDGKPRIIRRGALPSEDF